MPRNLKMEIRMQKETKKKTASKKELKIESNELDPRIFEEPGMDGFFLTLLDRIKELNEKEDNKEKSDNSTD